MRTPHGLFLFLFSLLVIGCQHQQQSLSPDIAVEGDLRAMTWNIRNANHDKGQYAWSNRKVKVVEIIQKTQPTVLCLQEALSRQISDIVKGYDQLKPSALCIQPNSSEHNVILFDNARLMCLESGIFWFSETPDKPSKSWGNQYQRYCHWVKFAMKNNNKFFYVFNLHLSHVSRPSREKSVELLLKKTVEIAGKSPVIVAGDFNALESSQAMTKFKSSAFMCAFRAKHPNRTVTTFNNFDSDYLSKEQRVIDYVFVDDENWKIVEGLILDETLFKAFASDHFPVYALLKFKEDK